jgi:hypothetical protein
MIKNKLLLVAITAASILIPAAVQAQGFSIEIGDRPYYRHGPRYWANDFEMIWVPGHREGRHWVHGHYMRGQQHRRHNLDRRYDDRQDFRRDDYRR